MKNIDTKSACRLTEREVEIWQLIAEGLANKQIAHVLEISVKTVEKHRQHVMDKLRIHNVAGLTRYAIAEGIITAVPECRLELTPGGQALSSANTLLRLRQQRFEPWVASDFHRPGSICNVPSANLLYEPKF